MHSHYEKTLAEVTKLDSWDIQSTLGAVNYQALQAAINTTVRMLPDLPPEASGNEGYTTWEQAMQAPAIKEAVAPLLGYAERTQDVLREYTEAEPFDFEHVLDFMTSRPPRRETFIAEYDARKRMGNRPGIPLSVFVDMEYATALQRHNNLVAKGQAAVHLLNQWSGNSASAPEWFIEAVDNKVMAKLEQRWMRAEVRRTNPRITKEQRDIAEANQALIVSVIEALGGKEPSFAAEMAVDDDVDAGVQAVQKMAEVKAAAKPAAGGAA